MAHEILQMATDLGSPCCLPPGLVVLHSLTRYALEGLPADLLPWHFMNKNGIPLSTEPRGRLLSEVRWPSSPPCVHIHVYAFAF